MKPLRWDIGRNHYDARLSKDSAFRFRVVDDEGQIIALLFIDGQEGGQFITNKYKLLPRGNLGTDEETSFASVEDAKEACERIVPLLVLM